MPIDEPEDVLKQYHLAIDTVLRYLSNRRVEAIEALFPEANERYKTEWYERTPADFWYHLDTDNQFTLITAAFRYYHPIREVTL